MSYKVFDNALVLKTLAITTAGIADRLETAIASPVRKNAEFKAIIYVTAIVTGGGETYQFHIDVSDVVGGTFTAIASVPVLSTTVVPFVVEIPLSGAIATFEDADCAFIRCGVNQAVAATAAVTYGCFLTRSDR